METESRAVELGHLVHPSDGVHPGVVMIHDVWGVTDHTRDLAGRLAGEGFSVLALDLYRRKGDWKIEEPGPWMRSLSDPEAIADVKVGVEFLSAHPAAAGRPVGVTGFCMGGMMALLAACADTGVAAAVPFYGLLSHEHGILFSETGLDPARKPRQPLDAVADLRCPMLCFFGDQDEFIPLADIESLKQRLAAVDPPTEVVVYPGAGHAFMNEPRVEAYRPEAARGAWARMTAFFRRHLAS
jgi:carboxymethylenebutenolidase